MGGGGGACPPRPPTLVAPLGVEQEGVRDKCTVINVFYFITQNIPPLQLMLIPASDVCKQ